MNRCALWSYCLTIFVNRGIKLLIDSAKIIMESNNEARCRVFIKLYRAKCNNSFANIFCYRKALHSKQKLEIMSRLKVGLDIS